MQKHQSIVIRGIDRFQMIGFQGENSRELLLFQKILFFNVSKKKFVVVFSSASKIQESKLDSTTKVNNDKSSCILCGIMGPTKSGPKPKMSYFIKDTLSPRDAHGLTYYYNALNHFFSLCISIFRCLLLLPLSMFISSFDNIFFYLVHIINLFECTLII